MEFAAAALTTIAAAGEAIGGAVATAATAAGTAISGSSLFSLGTAASVLSGLATVGSVLSARDAGEEKAESLEFQAQDAEVNAQLESIQGLERRTSLKRSLVQALGERDVAAAASGVDLSFGTPALARAEAKRDADLAIATDKTTEDFRKSRLLERASNYRIMAEQARRGALGKAATLALEGGARALRRG